jgi:hypothetical protein
MLRTLGAICVIVRTLGAIVNALTEYMVRRCRCRYPYLYCFYHLLHIFAAILQTLMAMIHPHTPPPIESQPHARGTGPASRSRSFRVLVTARRNCSAQLVNALPDITIAAHIEFARTDATNTSKPAAGILVGSASPRQLIQSAQWPVSLRLCVRAHAHSHAHTHAVCAVTGPRKRRRASQSR